MPRIGVEEIRKKQLIEATIAVIHEVGFTAATIAKISKHAGLSTGIVAHYFTDKDGLLVATQKHLMQELGQETRDLLAQADSPHKRLMAIVNANFSDNQFKKGVADVWLAFWALVPQSPQLSRLHRINEQRMQSNFRSALQPLIGEQHINQAAISLASLIEGLWLRCALSDGGITPAEARSIMKQHIDTLIESGCKDS
ncbi:choline-binding transcriptional repressor BetI [Kiloniella sp. b19]|uniref:choline-binding transcriptional repressor BetI n=1 Tax=Kiloniella sp. GXU_MW_B19 TaxID=3141326 RepID=UPI0031DFB237